MATLVLVLLIFATLGSGMIAGLFWSFSSFIMEALEDVEQHGGMKAMQGINLKIMRPTFAILFFGTAIVSMVATAVAWADMSVLSLMLILAGSACYFLGALVVTAVVNVPMNNRLAVLEADTEDGQQMWHYYLAHWTRWNHVRTVATMVSTLCFATALWLS